MLSGRLQFPCKLLMTRQWISEILHFQPSTPILLVGMKADLRNDPGTIGELLLSGLGHPVTREEVRLTGTYGFPN